MNIVRKLNTYYCQQPFKQGFGIYVCLYSAIADSPDRNIYAFG